MRIMRRKYFTKTEIHCSTHMLIFRATIKMRGYLIKLFAVWVQPRENSPKAAIAYYTKMEIGIKIFNLLTTHLERQQMEAEVALLCSLLHT